jgi:hypothetical protein
MAELAPPPVMKGPVRAALRGRPISASRELFSEGSRKKEPRDAASTGPVVRPFRLGTARKGFSLLRRVIGSV